MVYCFLYTLRVERIVYRFGSANSFEGIVCRCHPAKFISVAKGLYTYVCKRVRAVGGADGRDDHPRRAAGPDADGEPAAVRLRRRRDDAAGDAGSAL